MIPGSGRSPGEGNGNPLQYSYLENSVNRGAWWATVHGVTESDTAEHTSMHCLQGIHPLQGWSECRYKLSLDVACKGFPGGSVVKNLPAVQEMQEREFNPWVGKILWRKAWQPAPVFLPGKFHGQRSWRVTVYRVTKSQT